MITRFLLLAGFCSVLLGCSADKKPTTVLPKGSPVAGAGSNNPDAGSGRDAILQKPFDLVAKTVMLKIGVEYRMALATGKPPKDKSEFETPLKTKRDLVDREVVLLYGVDPTKLDENGSKHMLAWEKDPDSSGGRMVLMADCVTVNYLNEEQFKNTPRAK
jgi:hypothetical protein